MLCNRSDADVVRIAHALADRYLPPGSPPPMAAPAASPHPAYTLAPDQLRAFVGRFSSDEADAAYRIARDGDHLSLEIERRPGMGVPLTPLSADAFQASSTTIPASCATTKDR